MHKVDILKKEGLLWNIELGTYNREIKRYGSVPINLIEPIFYYDSNCFLNLESDVRFMDNEKDRLMYAIANADAWLNLFEFNQDEKIIFIEKIILNFSIEFESFVDTKSIYLLYRNNKDDLHLTLGDPIVQEFTKRSEAITNLLDM